MEKITHTTVVPIGLAITFSTVIFSAGILYNKVEYSLTQINDVKMHVSRLEEKVDRFIIQTISSSTYSADSTPMIPKL